MAVSIAAPTSQIVIRSGGVQVSWDAEYPQSAYEILYRRKGEQAWNTFGRIESSEHSAQMDLSGLEDFSEYHYRVVCYAVDNPGNDETTLYSGSDSSAAYSLIVVPENQLATAKIRYGDEMVEVPVYEDVADGECITVALPEGRYGQIPLDSPDSAIASRLRVEAGGEVKAALGGTGHFEDTGVKAGAYMEVKSRYSYADNRPAYTYYYRYSWTNSKYYYYTRYSYTNPTYTYAYQHSYVNPVYYYAEKYSYKTPVTYYRYTYYYNGEVYYQNNRDQYSYSQVDYFEPPVEYQVYVLNYGTPMYDNMHELIPGWVESRYIWLYYKTITEYYYYTRSIYKHNSSGYYTAGGETRYAYRYATGGGGAALEYRYATGGGDTSYGYNKDWGGGGTSYGYKSAIGGGEEGVGYGYTVEQRYA